MFVFSYIDQEHTLLQMRTSEQHFYTFFSGQEKLGARL